MMKRTLDKKSLDRVGEKLVLSDQMPAAEIDRIVSRPDLFALVNARIAAEQKNAVDQRHPLLGVGIAKPLTVIFGVITVALGAAFVVPNLSRPEPSLVAINEVEIPEAFPEVARPAENPPQGTVEKLSAGRSPARLEQASYKPTPAKAEAVKAVYKAPRPTRGTQTEAAFYPLSFAGDPHETGSGSRVVRVEMPRSSLFAMGVNIPLENGPETVKADLLIGRDGVARGIRVVQ